MFWKSGSTRFVVAIWLGCVPAIAQNLAPRQVAAPASDILSGIVRLPDPASAPVVSGAIVLPLRFRRERGRGWTAEISFPVERAGELKLGLLSPDAGTWRVLAGAPGDALRPLDRARVQLAGEELPGWVVQRSELSGPRPGEWTVRVEADDPSGARPPGEGWLLAKPAGDLRLETYVTTQHLVGGARIAIAAKVSEDGDATGRVGTGRGGTGRVGTERIVEGRVVLESAGRSREIPIDGSGEAVLPDDVRGELRARVEITGTTGEGQAFLRAAQLSFTVLEPRLLLETSAQASVIDDGHLAIGISALPLAPPSRLHVSAEIWGEDEAGEVVPVCWLSRMLVPAERDGTWSLSLVLDTRWIEVAGARAPFELREVRVQDPDTEVVLDRAARMALATPPLPPGRGTRAITTDMLTGAGPRPSIPPHGLSPGLVLVHGYCSGGSVWPAADYTQPKLGFLDPNANRTHDQFAQLIAQQAGAAGLTSFGIVAHSQGGCAALHLLTYYESGLDLARHGRKIQSVATPYQGTPLASWGGFACGVNNDMTPAGSTTWLAGIPSWARAEVSYWTTSNSGSACSGITDFLLTNPEDGTVEMFRGQLPGASSMGHVTGWCHTTGMSNPANYTDHARNQSMNAAAAR